MQRVLTHIRKVVQQQGSFRPLLVTDIDGVLLRGSCPIPGTKEALLALKESSVPYTCLTNGGGMLQATKSAKMNQIFNEELFSSENVFMAHSPLRPYLRKYSKEGLLLITGSNKIQDILKDMGIHNYITADELYTIFKCHGSEGKPHRFLRFKTDKDKPDEIKARIQQRLQRDTLPKNYSEWGEQIRAIFALNDVSPYEKALEVIHNIFQQRKNDNQSLPPYFAAQNDIAFAARYYRPRMAFGPFNHMLEHHCKIHGFQYDKYYFGKPEKIAFQYVGNIMKQKYGEGCFIMFGDNPRADIKGANQVGWISFLTQTGVHLGGSNNDVQNPATMVVETFKQAIDLILKIKHQKLYE